MSLSTDRARAITESVEYLCRETGATVYLLEDDGETLQQSLDELPKARRPKGLVVSSSHPVYRRYFGEADQIEKVPILLLLPGSAWGVVDDDCRLRITGITYRSEGPLIPQTVETDDPDDEIGIILFFFVPITRF